MNPFQNHEQSFNIRFVQEVEKHPCLYDYTVTEYSRKDVVSKSWKAVGKLFDMSETQAKEKWKNLRAVFVRHAKPDPNNTQKKSYYLNDAMQFTVPFIRVLNKIKSANSNSPKEPKEDFTRPMEPKEDCTVSNEVIKEEDTTQEDIEEDLQSPSPPHYNEPELKIIVSTVPWNQAASSPDPLSPECPSPSHESGGSKRRKKNVEETTSHSQKESHQNSVAVDEAKRLFLLSLLPDIKAMSDAQTRTFKRKVLALVDEILEESQSQ